MTMTIAPETKTTDAVAAVHELARGFEAYREENDARLAEMETRRGLDPLTEEKLARMDKALDEQKRRVERMHLDRQRPALGASAQDSRDPAQREHKAAFDAYVRCGEAAGLKGLEAKALSAGSGPDSGYLVPATVEAEVLRRLSVVSPIRAIASVRAISGGLYKRAYSVAGAAAGWVAETAARPETASPTLAEMSFPAMELYAMDPERHSQVQGLFRRLSLAAARDRGRARHPDGFSGGRGRGHARHRPERALDRLRGFSPRLPGG
jgi:HK97 family phage major capsid protein